MPARISHMAVHAPAHVQRDVGLLAVVAVAAVDVAADVAAGGAVV